MITVAPRVLPLRRVVGWAAAFGTLPYLALKFAWLAGSTIGVIDKATFSDPSIVVLNAVTAGMDLVGGCGRVVRVGLVGGRQRGRRDGPLQ